MKASSESGECASLISTGSFSVFEAVCWPGMGLSVSFCGATPARPGRSHEQSQSRCLGLAWVPPRETFPRRRGSIGDERKRTCASQGPAGRQTGRFLARGSLAYWRPANNWNEREQEAREGEEKKGK